MLAVQDKPTVWTGGATPVPVVVSVVVVTWALLVKLRLELSAPATSGL